MFELNIAIKKNIIMALNIICIILTKYRKLICKLRTSDHSLERGRYRKIPRNERICKKCKTIDDEFHLFF